MTTIEYEDAGWIYSEVLRGITESPTDNAEQRAYRAQLAKEVEEIRAQGGSPEPRKE